MFFFYIDKSIHVEYEGHLGTRLYQFASFTNYFVK